MNSRDARHAEIKRRYKRRAGARTSLAALRVRDLTRLFRARHGYQLPDDSIGRDCAGLMCHHLAALSGDPRKRINDWLRLWCPWMALAEAEDAMAQSILHTRRWRADKLAWRLQLIEADRTALRITTIGSIDVGKAERIQRRKERNKLAKAERRRAKGAKPRAQYLAAVKAPKPWTAAGISRATWYRMRQPNPMRRGSGTA